MIAKPTQLYSLLLLERERLRLNNHFVSSCQRLITPEHFSLCPYLTSHTMCKRRYIIPFTGCGRIHLSEKCNMNQRRKCALFKEYHASYKLQGRSRSQDCDACRGLGLKEQLKGRLVPRRLRKSENSAIILGALFLGLAVVAWYLGARGMKEWARWAWSWMAWYLGIGRRFLQTAQAWALWALYYPKLAFDAALGLPAYGGLLGSGAGGYYWPLTPYERITTGARFLALVATFYFAASKMGLIGGRLLSRGGPQPSSLKERIFGAFRGVGRAVKAVSLFFMGLPASPHRNGFWPATIDGWVSWILWRMGFAVLAFVGYNMYLGLIMFGWRPVIGVTSRRDVWTALKLVPRFLLAASLAVRVKMCEASCYTYANSGLLRWSNEVGCRYNCWFKT